ncbi:MAG: glycosyltransferase [Bacteroidales bacterium]|jgi:glycosyltransferase involved in cell wall biosynthesis|nr:glycosyltransferase [Bacteroidales bacterium]
MKLFFIIPSLGFGGAERVLLELAGNWTISHSIYILTLTNKEDDFYDIPENVIRYKVSSENDKWYDLRGVLKLILQIIKIINTIKPDFIVSFLLKANFFSLLAGFFVRRRIIICERNIILDPNISKHHKLLRKCLYPYAYKITVQHEQIYHEFIESHPAIPPDKVFITPNPIKKFTRDSQNSVDLHSFFGDFTDRDKLMIGVGRFTPVKAFKDLIYTFSLINMKKTNVRLAILGEGSEYAECKELLRKLSLEKVIVLPGTVKNINSWYAAADLFVTTTYYEGFPNALAESLAAGLPAIAFDAPSISVLIKDGINGFVIGDRSKEKMAEKTVFILDNPDVYERMSKEAEKISDIYSFDNINKIWFDKVFI